MALPNTQKIHIPKGLVLQPDWYRASLVGHEEKSDNNVISSHIEFELLDKNMRVRTVLAHQDVNLPKIKRLKEALGMADEETDLSVFYNRQLRVYVDAVLKDDGLVSEVIDFEPLKQDAAMGTMGTAEIIQQSQRKIPKQILIVDDQPEVALLIGNYVEQIGFIPDIVVTVDEAIDKFDPSRYLMVIADVIMPGKNGFDLVRSLHNDFPDVSIALISGYFDKEMENLQKLFGIEKIYRKPVFFKSVKEMVATALKSISSG